MLDRVSLLEVADVKPCGGRILLEAGERAFGGEQALEFQNRNSSIYALPLPDIASLGSVCHSLTDEESIMTMIAGDCRTE